VLLISILLLNISLGSSVPAWHAPFLNVCCAECSRLSQIVQADIETLDRLGALMKPEKNFKDYRAAIEQARGKVRGMCVYACLWL
jgi:hypothetical protein